MTAELTLLRDAEQILARISGTDEALNLIDMAEAARVLARQARLGTASVNHATVIKLRAERRLADIVDEGQRAGTIATQKDGGPRNHVRGPDMVGPARLEDLGVDRQRLAEARRVRDNYTDAQLVTVAAQATAEDRCLARADFIRNTAHVANNSGMNEWYTPPEYIEAARTVLGHIALDPASSVKAQQTVRASVFYTADDDGLAQDWFGPVWLNPPYAQPLIGRFVDKLVTSGVEGICLVNNATETEWGAKLLAAAQRVCFPTGRIRFLDPAGNPGAPLQGQMVAYLGAEGARFAQVFTRFGTVLDG